MFISTLDPVTQNDENGQSQCKDYTNIPDSMPDYDCVCVVYKDWNSIFICEFGGSIHRGIVDGQWQLWVWKVIYDYEWDESTQLNSHFTRIFISLGRP